MGEVVCDNQMRIQKHAEKHRLPGSPTGETYGAFLIPLGNGWCYQCIVADGTLSGWEHVSVCIRRSDEFRTPEWHEMEYVRSLFWKDSATVFQFSVPRGDHINIHPNVLHLWRPTTAVVPLPPKECV